MIELEIAKRAAEAGGKVLLRYFRSGVAVRDKGPQQAGDERKTYNLVSDADLESEQSIVDVIRQTFPNHHFLAEESHDAETTAGDLWIIDPIDGTNNFVHGIPHSAVSIAYYRNKQPVCGIVYNPMREDWYVCARGQGAFYNDVQVHVNDSRRIDEVLVGTGFYYDRGAMMEATLAAIRDLFLQNIHGIRRFGTASLDLVMVGCGSFGAFFEYQLAPWDFAAGRLFVEEAGGVVSTCTGAALPLAKSGVLATNGQLHRAVLDVVANHCPD